MKIKPIGRKSYGSIPHLPESRTGPGDHSCSIGQARIATEKARDRHDKIIVQEKVDGSNVGVAKKDGLIIPLGRSGYEASTSPYLQHRLFANWVYKEYSRFDKVLEEGERLCGEWLAQAHGTKYNLPHEPLVVFDLMVETERITYEELTKRIKGKFVMPNLIHQGSPFSIKDAMNYLKKSGHGALDEVEGAVWRVERREKVDFLVKYVKPNKVDGSYLESVTGKEPIWNVNEEFINRFRTESSLRRKGDKE